VKNIANISCGFGAPSVIGADKEIVSPLDTIIFCTGLIKYSVIKSFDSIILILL